MIGKLGLIMIGVAEMDRSVAFYRDVLGLQVEFESPYWSQLTAGNISIGLHAGDEELVRPDGGATISFYVDDAEAAFAELTKRGAEPATEPHREEFGGTVAVVRDSDGYPIQLLQMS